MKGSIEKRGTYSWRLRVDLGYNPDGTRNRPPKTIKLDDPAQVEDPELMKSLVQLSERSTGYKDASRKLKNYLDDQLAEFKREVLSGTHIAPARLTVQEFYENEWLPKYGENPDNLSPTTLNQYKTHIEARLLPVLGNKQLNQITTLQLLNLFKKLEEPGMRKRPKTKKPLTDEQIARYEKPLTSSTLLCIYRAATSLFSRAVEWRVLQHNPLDGVQKPKERDARERMLEARGNPQYYDETEARQVVVALYKEPRKWRLFMLGSMIGGCRRGELVGLEWDSINFKQGLLTIEQTIPLTEGGEALVKGPKTIASYRDIDMPDWYMAELLMHYKEWQEEQKQLEDEKLWKGGSRKYVFHSGAGRPYYYKYPTLWWERFCKRHKIRYIKLHGLRHSMGTLLIEDESGNTDKILKAIQERLGHSRKSTTEDIYVHLTRTVERRTAGLFDKFAP